MLDSWQEELSEFEPEDSAPVPSFLAGVAYCF